MSYPVPGEGFMWGLVGRRKHEPAAATDLPHATRGSQSHLHNMPCLSGILIRHSRIV